MVDPVFLVLLILHVGAIVSWMGGAILFVSVINPSIRTMTAPARSEFVVNVIPRYVRFVGGTSLLAVIAGVILYGYSVQAGPPIAPSTTGTPYIQAGAVLALIAIIIAFAVLIPSSRKLVSLVKQGSGDDKRMAEIGSLQKRLGIAARTGAGLLGVTLILMIVGASL